MVFPQSEEQMQKFRIKKSTISFKRKSYLHRVGSKKYKYFSISVNLKKFD